MNDNPNKPTTTVYLSPGAVGNRAEADAVGPLTMELLGQDVTAEQGHFSTVGLFPNAERLGMERTIGFVMAIPDNGIGLFMVYTPEEARQIGETFLHLADEEARKRKVAEFEMTFMTEGSA